MYYKPDIDKVRKRFDAFWHQDIQDRVCVSVIAPIDKSKGISMFHNPSPDDGDMEKRLRYWTDPETILKNNIERLENTFLGGDTLPVIFSNFGTSGHCNYYGAKPTYGHDTIWFDETWQSLENLESHSFDDDVLSKHLELTEFLAKNGEGKFYVSMPDHCGTIDALGHLYGTQNVLMDMMVEPDSVKAAVSHIDEGWIKANSAFNKLLTQYSGGGTAHAWMHLWAPGKMMQLQVDMSVMISPQMYEDFAMPELITQASWCDYPIYHFDGQEQINHLDYILEIPKLKAIQWTAVAGQPSAIHYADTLRRMQAAGKSLIIMTPPEDIPALMDNLSHKGLYLHTEVTGVQEAENIVDYVAKHSKAN